MLPCAVSPDTLLLSNPAEFPPSIARLHEPLLDLKSFSGYAFGPGYHIRGPMKLVIDTFSEMRGVWPGGTWKDSRGPRETEPRNAGAGRWSDRSCRQPRSLLPA